MTEKRAGATNRGVPELGSTTAADGQVARVELELFQAKLASLNAPDARARIDAVLARKGKLKVPIKAGPQF